jgi:hypothetical protein
MTNALPEFFDEPFLRWLQQRTEEAWQAYETDLVTFLTGNRAHAGWMG